MSVEAFLSAFKHALDGPPSSLAEAFLAFQLLLRKEVCLPPLLAVSLGRRHLPCSHLLFPSSLGFCQAQLNPKADEAQVLAWLAAMGP